MPPTTREITRTASFDKDLAKLERRHSGITASVEQYLERCASRPPDRRYRQQGLGGKPVFKERLSWPGSGKRGGARVIVHCDDETVDALFVFVKSDRETLPAKVIRQALARLESEDQDVPDQVADDS